MSPSRSTESLAWWKSCQIWASRSTGWLTRPASMLNATSSPTVRSAGDDQLGSEIQNARHDDLVDELHAVAGVVAEPQDPEARRHIAGELLFPASLHLRLDRHRLEGLDPGDALHQKRLVLRAAPELLVEQLAKQRRRAGGNPDVERKSGKHDAVNSGE